MPNRRQAIIWTNADLIHWRIFSTRGRLDNTGTWITALDVHICLNSLYMKFHMYTLTGTYIPPSYFAFFITVSWPVSQCHLGDGYSSSWVCKVPGSKFLPINLPAWVRLQMSYTVQKLMPNDFILYCNLLMFNIVLEECPLIKCGC